MLDPASRAQHDSATGRQQASNNMPNSTPATTTTEALTTILTGADSPYTDGLPIAAAVAAPAQTQDLGLDLRINDSFGSISTPEYLAIDFPEPTWTVPGMLTAGVAIVAGPPKAGKTWIVMQLAMETALGGNFLGHKLEAADVLYITLEGNTAFMQERVAALCGDGTVPENLRWAFAAERLHDGFEEQVEEYLNTYQGTRLVIVDTLVRIGARTTGRRTQYAEDAETLAKVVELASRWPETCFLFVHHTRECKADDPLDLLAGSRGLTATIDTAWVLQNKYQPSGESMGILATRGRNLKEQQELALEFDKETCRWECKGDAKMFVGGETRQDILDAIRDSETGVLTPKELAEDLGKPPATVRKTLSRMVEAGQLVKGRAGYSIDPVPF